MKLASVYKQIAVGDALLFAALAAPGLGGWILDLLLAINHQMSWPGALSTSPGVYLLLHLLGVLGLGFAGLRLRVGPAHDAAIISVLVKLAAAALFTGFVIYGAPAVFLVLALADGVQALLLIFALRLAPAPYG